MRRSVPARLTWLVMIAILVVAGGVALAADTPRKGGVIRVGNLGEPPSLDAHWTTASITETLTNHIYEGLYSLDNSNKPIPMLAEGVTISKDGLVYTFKLRQGVKFHNGKEMTSEDVVASLARWGKQSVYGKALFAQVADWKALDKYTVEMKLKEKSAIVLISLAVPNNFGAIYPKEIAEKSPPEQKVTEYIGTGPFKLAEWKPDQYIRMVRFDEYKSRNEKPNGYGGGKTAYVDEIRWIPVPEVATRVAQVETGELDFAEGLVIMATLLSAGGESTTSLLGYAVYMLAVDQELQDRLRADPKLVTPFIEEALRLESPFRYHMRYVKRPTQLQGTPIAEGSTVLLFWGAANRDPAEYDRPDTFDPDRGTLRHLGFGRGAHYCLGAPLARLEAGMALSAITARFPDARLASEPQYKANVTLRGLSELRVRL